jgi:hypothetical protein
LFIAGLSRWRADRFNEWARLRRSRPGLLLIDRVANRVIAKLGKLLMGCRGLVEEPPDFPGALDQAAMAIAHCGNLRIEPDGPHKG